MENKFDKIDYSLRLLKEDTEKIDDEGIDIIGKFEKYLKNRERETYFLFRIKYTFVSLAIVLFLINLFILFTKMHFKREVKNLVKISNEEKNLVAKFEQVKKIDIVPSKYKKKKEIKYIGEREKIEINNIENKVAIVETIEFTEEINKIVNLFKVDLNIGGKDVEI